jgi:hypothetical protein
MKMDLVYGLTIPVDASRFTLDWMPCQCQGTKERWIQRVFCAYEVEACTGAVKVNVSFDMRLHCRGLKPKRRLLLPNPNLPDQISDDVSASRLIASASIRPHPPVELLCAVGVEAFALRKTPLFFEFSLCLSRACLGKMFVFIYKWHKKWRFSHRRSPCCDGTITCKHTYT